MHSTFHYITCDMSLTFRSAHVLLLCNTIMSWQTGDYLMERLRQLQPSFPFLGDVRGLGLFVGIDVVRCPESKQHAPMVAK